MNKGKDEEDKNGKGGKEMIGRRRDRDGREMDKGENEKKEEKIQRLNVE